MIGPRSRTPLPPYYVCAMGPSALSGLSGFRLCRLDFREPAEGSCHAASLTGHPPPFSHAHPISTCCHIRLSLLQLYPRCNSSSCRATIAARTCLMAATCASGPSSAAYGARTAATLASPSASSSAASPVPGTSPTVPPRPPLAARAVALALAVTAPPPLATAEAVATIACTSAASTLVGGGASISSLWSEIGRSACTSKSNGPSCATPKVAGIRTRWVPAAGLGTCAASER